ncbi:hypothetical protein [Crenobacter cavernae]|uniref:Uncharacterized protein n=1 Tax=Crenobacter cavernae TaxID=2290923 RepID=A0ABY0FDE5_9NEIS|nr:hypothetical protein [Crenobacter cavernae]RXZ44205.1 hypothetical protein EBB06_06615 [Crenobacter cavernae]
MDDQAFLQALESRALPVSEFNHQAHLLAAWAYCRRYPGREAAARCAYSLSRYAMAMGVADKYHHTLTMAILAILYSRVVDHPELRDDWDAFCAACPDIVDDARGVVLAYYSEERLDNDSARRAFVEPDIQPLPTGGLLH